MSSPSLTGLFAPGSAALPEVLRTLVVEPSRVAQPGDTIRVHFSFSNLGGAAATGVRVRCAHPQGVEHVTGGDLVDDAPLPDGAAFVEPHGAPVADLEPNGACRITCTFRVNDTIEDGTQLLFQAALVTDQTQLTASNVERVTVRSRPELRNAATLVTLTAPPQPKPGDAVTARATVRNTGSSSAHDVVVMLPVPEHTTYIAHSARIDGRVVAGIDGEAFDYDRTAVVSERLAPGQSVLVEYQATIDSPLVDGTRICVRGSVGSRETSEFEIASDEIVVQSPVDFTGEETAFVLQCDEVVTPGMRVPMVVRALNVGTGIAERVQVTFTLPHGLIYAPGSAHVDGQPVGDDAIEGLTFTLGALAAGRMVEVGIAATVAVPEPGQNALPVDAVLRWKTGERSFSRRLTVRVAPRFSRARNFVEADRGVAHAREELTFAIHVYNDGTAPESDVKLRIAPGLQLTDVRVGEGDELFAYGEPIALGVVQPHQERIFTVHARVVSRVADRSNATLAAMLERAEGAIDLGTSTIVVRSRPYIESVAWELATTEPLRPHRTVDVIVRVHNSGSDVLRDGHLALSLPPDLAIERTVDARRERDGLGLPEIPAESTHEARITLRLLAGTSGARTLQLDGWLHGRGITPVQFATLGVPTFAQAQFAQSTQLFASPSDAVNAGERLFYELRMRNDGDGPADRLTVRVVPTNLAVYVPSSTTLNGMNVNDDAGTSQAWSARGLALADVNPGVELRLRWEMIVMAPLAAGTPLDTRAVLEWADGITHAVAAPTVRVQSEPSLSESAAGTPISIARLFPAAAQGEVLDEPIAEQVSLEAPASSQMPEPPRAIAEIVAAQPELPAAGATAHAEISTPLLYVDFTAERLANTIRMLERSDSAGGLVQHLFAMRMLFPEHAIGAPAQLAATFATATRQLRVPLEKLFVRLRMPRLTITGKDIEDREGRDALRTLVDELAFAPSASPEPPPAQVVRIVGGVELDVVRALVADLESAPIGTVAPWLVNAQLLGTTIYHDGHRSDELETYRAELLNIFSVLNELPMEEFHRVLTSSVNRALDEALAHVLDALRGAAHLAVE